MRATGDLAACETRLALRLGRLFRVERVGALARRPARIANLFLRRRDALIAELIETDRRRFASATPATPELDRAARALSYEIEASRLSAGERAEKLDRALRAARGEAMASGMRNDAPGRVIGRG
jgi:hypothetical protein